MRWSDVTRSPSNTTLRQFAVLFLAVFGSMAGWRAWNGRADGVSFVLAALGLVVGLAGLVRPATIRYLFTGWMIAAFPIGWAVSKIMLGVLFYAMFTPVAAVFRLMQRDVLQRRRRQPGSYWTDKIASSDVREYFRQF